MKLIFRSIARYKWAIVLAIFVKLLGTMAELMLPYILEHMVDDVVPTGELSQVIIWGLMMFVAAIACRMLNVTANRKAIFNAHRVSYDVQSMRTPPAFVCQNKSDDCQNPQCLLYRRTVYNPCGNSEQFMNVQPRAAQRRST